MKTIDLDNWPRKEHYLFFREFEYPYFSLCADMDISAFLPLVKDKEISFTAAIMYLVARVANGIPEFRQRIREGSPIEHDLVHPSATVLSQNVRTGSLALGPPQRQLPDFDRRCGLHPGI